MTLLIPFFALPVLVPFALWAGTTLGSRIAAREDRRLGWERELAEIDAWLEQIRAVS